MISFAPTGTFLDSSQFHTNFVVSWLLVTIESCLLKEVPLLPTMILSKYDPSEMLIILLIGKLQRSIESFSFLHEVLSALLPTKLSL